ncbi:hypothetical protein VPH35_044228 [Triticum aestivum]
MAECNVLIMQGNLVITFSSNTWNKGWQRHRRCNGNAACTRISLISWVDKACSLYANPRLCTPRNMKTAIACLPTSNRNCKQTSTPIKFMVMHSTAYIPEIQRMELLGCGIIYLIQMVLCEKIQHQNLHQCQQVRCCLLGLQFLELFPISYQCTHSSTYRIFC